MKKIILTAMATMLCANLLVANAEFVEYDLDNTVFDSPMTGGYVEHDLDKTTFDSVDLDEQEFQSPNLDEQVFQGDNPLLVYQYFTDSDYDALIAFQDDWKTANEENDEQGKIDAHKGAEDIRAKYGFSGGDDGSQVIKQ